MLKRIIFRLKLVLLAPRDKRPRLTAIDFVIFILIFMKNCLQCSAIHEFLEWLRTTGEPYKGFQKSSLIRFSRDWALSAGF